MPMVASRAIPRTEPLSRRPTAEAAGLVFNIMRFSLHDGPGIRTTVFLKGCPLRCAWCHNPESQSSSIEVLYFEDRCVRSGECVPACPHGALRLDGRLVLDELRCQRCGYCADACPSAARQIVGRWMTVPEVIAEVTKDRVFFDSSGGGVTVSGGEPLMQPDFLETLLKACRARGLHTVLETSGCGAADVLRRIAPDVGLFLYDLKAMDPEQHQRLTGARNAQVLQNLALLAELGRPVIVRVPVIPGVNDGEGELEAISRQLASLGLRRIDLLPYHRIGSEKYRRMHQPYRMEGVEPPSPERMEALADRLRQDGFTVRIGG